MPNLDSLNRHLSTIDDKLKSLEFYCETEIVGDDARHLLCDIQGAMRELTRTVPQELKYSDDLKALSDRIKSIRASLRVLSNTLRLSMEAVEDALDAVDHMKLDLDEFDGDDQL